MSQKQLDIIYNDNSFKLTEIPSTFNAFIAKIKQEFKSELPLYWSIQYEDSEGDLISLKNSDDYEGLVSELEDGERSVKVVLKKSESGGPGFVESQEEQNELESSISDSNESYNVLDNQENNKKSDSKSDLDVIEVGSMNESQGIQAVDLKKDIEERLSDLKLSQEKSRSAMKSSQKSESEKLKESSIVERKSERQEDEVINKDNLCEKSFDNSVDENERLTREEVDKLNESLSKSLNYSVVKKEELNREEQQDQESGRLNHSLSKSQNSYMLEKEKSELPQDERLNSSLRSLGTSILKRDEPESAIKEDLNLSSSFLLVKEGHNEPRDLIESVIISNKPEIIESERLNKSEFDMDLSRKRESKKEVVVHYGVKCDGCEKMDITGVRYKCSECEDFDFCEECEANREHPHLFLRIKSSEDSTKLKNNGPRMGLLAETEEALIEWEDGLRNWVGKVYGYVKGNCVREGNNHQENRDLNN